ncbi:MAG: tail fiber assembly protein, partial [Aeromonas sobria]
VAPYTGPTKADEEAHRFNLRKRVALEKVEALLAPLQRAVKFGIATPEEEEQLTRLEMHSVMVMRAKSGPLPTLADKASQ